MPLHPTQPSQSSRMYQAGARGRRRRRRPALGIVVDPRHIEAYSAGNRSASAGPRVALKQPLGVPAQGQIGVMHSNSSRAQRLASMRLQTAMECRGGTCASCMAQLGNTGWTCTVQYLNFREPRKACSITTGCWGQQAHLEAGLMKLVLFWHLIIGRRLEYRYHAQQREPPWTTTRWGIMTAERRSNKTR